MKKLFFATSLITLLLVGTLPTPAHAIPSNSDCTPREDGSLPAGCRPPSPPPSSGPSGPSAPELPGGPGANGEGVPDDGSLRAEDGWSCQGGFCWLMNDSVTVGGDTGGNRPGIPPIPGIPDLPFGGPGMDIDLGNIGGTNGVNVDFPSLFQHPDGEKECAAAVASGAAAPSSIYAGSYACADSAGNSGVSHVCKPTPTSSNPAAAMSTSCKFSEPPPPPAEAPPIATPEPTPAPTPTPAPKPDQVIVRPPQPAPDWFWNGTQWAPPSVGGGISGGGVIPAPSPVTPTPTPTTPTPSTPTPTPTPRPDLTAGAVLHPGVVLVGVLVDLSALIANIGTIPTDQ